MGYGDALRRQNARHGFNIDLALLTDDLRKLSKFPYRANDVHDIAYRQPRLIVGYEYAIAT